MWLIVTGGCTFVARVTVFPLRSHDSSFCWSNVYTIYTQRNFCWFLFPKWYIKNVTTDLALFSVVKIVFRVLNGWSFNTFFVSAFCIVHISKNISDWFWRFSKSTYPWVTNQTQPVCLFFKGKITDLTCERALRNLIIISAESLKKNYCARKVSRKTICSDNTRSQWT